MAEKTQEAKPGITALDPATIELIKTIAAELRKPSELEQEELEDRKRKREKENEQVAAANAERRENAHLVRQQIAQREQFKKVCLHEGGRPSHSYAVFVHDPFGGYIICQQCQAVVRPTEARDRYPQDYKGSIIFDSALFNRLFQGTSDSGIFA